MRKSVFTPEYDILRGALRAARAGAKLSQRDLAGALGVPHSWVAKVESGERRIDLVECCAFLAACGEEPGRAIGRVIGQIAPKNTRRRAKGAR